eukprot:Nitzschia sp. Nitz4//scaffold15_size197535//123755//127659//NITZ4_001590-RA/size197535-augustus-gene-0.214-mRNA-1//1//CDS//3329537751//2930//frame0
MKTQPTLVRVLTPPPIGPSSFVLGNSQKEVVSNALAVHLSKAVPTAPPRVSPFKMHFITVHPSEPLVAFLIVPDGIENKKKLQKALVVQHTKTREIIWSMTFGDVVSALFDFGLVSKGSSEAQAAKQQKFLKDLGEVQQIDFFDPASLYWSGNATVSGPQDLSKRWSLLLVQFQTRIVIFNLRRNAPSIVKTSMGDPSMADKNAFQPVIDSITSDALGAPISSNAVPVTAENLVVATTDGSLKLYNWKKNVVVQSIKPILFKGDTIVQIITANKYQTPTNYYEQTKRRIVCLTKKGTAMLLEILVTEGIVHDITQPLVRFEGGSVPNNAVKQDDDHTVMEHIYLQYCGFRDLLLWSYPSKGAKGRLLVWDLGNMAELDSKTNRRGETPKVEPLLVTQFPYETTHTIFPGWFHESMPMESMTCAAVTKEGDFQILVAPLYNSGSNTKNAYSAFTILSVNLLHVIQRDMLLPEEREVHLKVHSVYAPPLRDSSIFYFGTNYGILMVDMVDGNLVQVPGTRHAHLNANFGGLGKALLAVKGPEITYSILEPTGGALAADPLGAMETKNTVTVHESPAPLHLPPEIHKRPVRLPPLFLMSPSRSFVCCFWKEEMRYEILQMAAVLERVTSRTQINKSAVVASGNGVASFAWVGDADVYSLLYNPEQDQALKVGIDLSAPTAGNIAKLRELKLKDIATGKTLTKGVSKLQSLKGLQDIGKGTVKGVAGLGKGTLKMTGKVTLAATRGTAGAVKQTGKLTMKTSQMAVGGGAKAAKFGLKAAAFGFGKRRGKDQGETSLARQDSDEEEETVATNITPLDAIGEGLPQDSRPASETLERKHPWVELRSLVEVTGVDGKVTGATPTGLGELTLRSGNRNPPVVLFGGPVLCVASKLDASDEGIAYFYTKKKGSEEESSSQYVSSGPAFPCPDKVVWDEDGRLCAIVLHSMVSIYYSEEPEFIMLGTVRLGTAADTDVQVVSARFIHGSLFCTTRSAVHVIFLGSLDGGSCHLDMFTIASSEVHTLPSKTITSEYCSLTPPTIPMPFCYPAVLGFQNGALVISTVAGVQALPLNSPLIRIGILLGSGHAQRAEKWFDAVPTSDHEALALFLERRGFPEMALKLSGLSLETSVDLCMRYEFVERLEELVEIYGLKGIRSIDMSRGVSSDVFGAIQGGASVVVCVGTYLLAHGKVELVRRLATECLRSGPEGKRDAFMLASILMSLDMNDSKRVMHRAVQGDGDDWVIGNYVRDHMLGRGR